MKLVPYIAETANAALARIQAELGPDAVVVSIRKLPAPGLARLWHRAGSVEVIAGVEEQSWRKKHEPGPGEDPYVPFGDKIEARRETRPARRWQSIAWLEMMGLLPAFADELEIKICAQYGDPPPLPINEWHLAHRLLADHWKPANHTTEDGGQPHVFIGPAGSGKTTALCKWMTRAVLAEERTVRVWRLDGETANTSEILSLQCELVGVPVERFWLGPGDTTELLFVDIPGVEPHNTMAMGLLREQVAALAQPHVHLVLNAAYDISILFEQFHAFAGFNPQDIIFTHLDEERRRVKLWNFVWGTNCSIRFLGSGQKIPGHFSRAETALLFPHENHR